MKQKIKKIKVGDFVKYKTKTGVIDDRYSDGHYLFAYHNGMKIRRDIVDDESKLIKITKKEFESYVQKSGNTSLYQFLE